MVILPSLWLLGSAFTPDQTFVLGEDGLNLLPAVINLQQQGVVFRRCSAFTALNMQPAIHKSAHNNLAHH